MKNTAFRRQEEKKNVGNRRVGNRTADSAEKEKDKPVKERVPELQLLNSTAEALSPD